MAASAQRAHEVPLPPPEKPEREPERRPELERTTVSVGAASIWVADVHRAAREFSRRRDGSAVSVSIGLEDGRRIEVGDLRSGPGEGFVTLVPAAGDDRELAVRLDRVVAVEYAALQDAGLAFRLRGSDVGFGAAEQR